MLECSANCAFQKLGPVSFQECSTELIRNALESTAPDASIGVPNTEIRPLGADLATSEKFEFRIWSNSTTLEAMRAAPSGPISAFGPPLGASRSRRSNVLRISAAHHTGECMKLFEK